MLKTDNTSSSKFECNKKLVEALIFASPEPASTSKIIEIVEEVNLKLIELIVESLNEDYQREGRSFHIVRGGGGYRFATLPEYGRWVKHIVVGSGRVRLSRAALETLSIIAYKQPISKTQIEDLRGVDAGGVLRMLLERKLINIKGRSNKPGKALLYETSSYFLTHFGLESLNDLPIPEEFEGFQASIEENTKSNDTVQMFNIENK